VTAVVKHLGECTADKFAAGWRVHAQWIFTGKVDVGPMVGGGFMEERELVDYRSEVWSLPVTMDQDTFEAFCRVWGFKP